ncbi:MAG: SDR family oxidoreductase [Spirochaetia bacterium]
MAGGLTGRELVNRLSRRGIPVRALIRDPLKADGLSSLPHVEIALGDMGRPETLSQALRDVERAMLISSSDPAMFDVQTRFAQEAVAAGVRHIVKLSGIMPEVDSPFRFAAMHGRIERRIEELGAAFTHLRAGEFFHAYFRQVSAIVGRGALMLPMEEARIASIDIGDIAEVAARVLTGSGHEGKVYPLTGPHALTMSEVAEKLSRATGRPIRYVNVTPEDARLANLARGMSPYMADALYELFAERRKGKEGNVSNVIPEVFAFSATSFDDFAERNAAIFRGEQPAPRI